MKFFDNPDKPIYVMTGYANLYYAISNTTGKISDKRTLAEWCGSNVDWVATTKDRTALITLLHKNKHTGSIPANSVLYFDKSSKFPRTKLANIDDISRCIKPAKANFIVLNSDEVKTIANYYYNNNVLDIVEYEDCYMATEANNSDVFKYLKATNPKTGMVYQNGFEVVEVNGLVGKRINRIAHDVRLTYMPASMADLFVKFNNEYNGKKYIVDNDLDARVNKGLDSLDIDAINTLDSMLGSTDGDVVNMAMRLLGNYNIAEYPLTIKTLLIFHGTNVFDAKAYNSGAFKQILATLDIDSLKNMPAFPMCLARIPIADKKGNKYVYSESDKQLYLKFTQARRDAYLGSLKSDAQKIIDKYHLNVKPL